MGDQQKIDLPDAIAAQLLAQLSGGILGAGVNEGGFAVAANQNTVPLTHIDKTDKILLLAKLGSKGKIVKKVVPVGNQLPVADRKQQKGNGKQRKQYRQKPAHKSLIPLLQLFLTGLFLHKLFL